MYLIPILTTQPVLILEKRFGKRHKNGLKSKKKKKKKMIKVCAIWLVISTFTK